MSVAFGSRSSRLRVSPPSRGAARAAWPQRLSAAAGPLGLAALGWPRHVRSLRRTAAPGACGAPPAGAAH
eukprot:10814793-Heterocapsa_arctica.AAC.1